jgi:ribulose-5-phosphate 4-epimerase/fuculose-1-phosphate aldolase
VAGLSRQVKQSIVDYARRAAAAGLVRGTQGNLSARDPASGVIGITPHALEYDELTPDDIVVVDTDGEVLEGSREPSEEVAVHLALYAARPDLRAAIHTEPPFTNVFGALGKPLQPVLVGLLAANGRPVPVMPFRWSGSRAFGEEMAKVLADGYAVIWGSHGLLTCGATLADAFRISVAVECSAEVYQRALQIGDPRVLGPEELAHRPPHRPGSANGAPHDDCVQ